MPTPHIIELRRLALRSGIERRTFSLAVARAPEVREAAAASRLLEGHASVFNQRSEPLGYGGWFVETIKPGAFTNSIKNDVAKALWNHNTDIVLASTKNGTLRLSEDDIGLAVSMEPIGGLWGDYAVASISRGDVDQMSFGFTVINERWRTIRIAGVEIEEREVLEARVHEVSPCGFPAYPQTDISARAFVGFDAQELMVAQLRCLHGVGTREDREIVMNAVRLLSAAAEEKPASPASEAEPRAASPSGETTSTDLLRRRLDLRARTFAAP